jgi:diguanylate cyclase (GGDEF)-like protein
MIDSSAFASAWFIWWLGDAMGIICFGPVTLMLAPGRSDAWSGRRLKVVIPTLMSILVSYGVWQFGGISAEDQARRVTQQRTQMASVELAYHASSYLRVVKDAASLFAALSDVGEKEFECFAGPVLRDEEEVLGLEWLEWVSSGDLEQFQERQRKDLDLPDYTVWTLGGKPLLHTAAADLHYAPVTFAATQSDFAANLGLDLSSSEVDSAALDQALANGAAMTEPFTTTTGISTTRVVRLVVPVYDVDSPPASEAERWEHLRGYLTLVLSLDRLLRGTFAGPNWADASIRLADTTNRDHPVPAAVRERTTDEGPAPSASATSMVAGRSWAIRLIPGAQSSRPANPYSTPLILLLGLLVAGLLESFLLVATGLERRLEHRVQISDYEATHDPLTDLINRREFLDRLDAARERALQAGLVQVLLFLDLDGFKQVNDTGGHAAGDDLLRLLAVRMRSTVRQADSVARLGGDEFAVLLPDCPVDRGLNIADDLVRAVADCGVEFEGRRLGVTASVGFVAIEPPEPSSTDELLRQADAACYLAKRSGKSQVRCYEPGIG